jgi:CBS domain-containing protein
MAKISCDEIMSKEIVRCGPGDKLREAARLMSEHHIGSLPVAEGGTLVGVVTDRDIVLRGVAREPDISHLTVADVMTKDPVTCSPTDDVDEAADRMMKHQIRRIFVVRNEQLVGVISQADIASRGGDRERTSQLLERVSQPGVPEPATM